MLLDFLLKMMHSEEITNNIVNLKGGYKKDNSIVYCSIESFVKAICNNRTLELEFFEESDKLSILVFDNLGTAVYKEEIEACPTLTIMVDMNEWRTEWYRVLITNWRGINIRGVFYLK